MISSISTFPAIDEGLQFAVVPSDLVGLVPLLACLPAVFAVLVDHLHLRVAENPHQVLGVELQRPHRAGPAPRGPLVSHGSHHLRVQHLEIDLGQGLLEAVLCGDAVVQPPVAVLHRANQEPVLSSYDPLGQLHLESKKQLLREGYGTTKYWAFWEDSLQT